MAAPRGQAAIRPYQPRQPSPPLGPMEITIAEVAHEEPQQEEDQELEEAREQHRRLGPSEAMMARYGVRVLPPETIAADETTPTADRADSAAWEEARAAARAVARAAAAAAREWE